MAEFQVRQVIETSRAEIITDVQTLNLGADAVAVEVTGFIDVEKIIRLGLQRFFIEKKKPFNLLIIRRPIFGEEEAG